MRLQKTKLFAGTTLSVLLSLVAISPAMARPAGSQTQAQTIAQMDSMSVTGRIRSIVGNVVTLVLPDGTTRDVMISRAERDRLGLRPGMEIMTMMRDGTMVVEVVSEGSNTADMTEGTTTESTSGQRVVEERTIRRTTTYPAVEQTTEQTTGDVQRSVQEVEQYPATQNVEETTQPARPVRALW
ncbi:MAG TPA: hypothetical protein V6D28_31740 [Leptolyngbyaceae cyanobacterium]